MGENSAIEWTDHTFNPWMGCTKVSEGCKHCYAEEMMDKRYGKVKWGPQGARVKTSVANWRKPLQWNKAAHLAAMQRRREASGDVAGAAIVGPWDVGVERPKVFCASLADVFEDRPELVAWRRELFEVIDATPWLDWLILTKRPENVRALWPERRESAREGWHYGGRNGLSRDFRRNVWVGTSVEDQAAADTRLPVLCGLYDLAALLFVSMEPLLAPVDVSLWLYSGFDDPPWNSVGWVIVGGESGPKARPMHPAWAYSVRDQCVKAGVPFFFKQWGEWLPETHYTDELRAKDPGEFSINFPGDWDGDDAFESDGFWADEPSEFMMRRVGKKLAGRELAGRVWDEMPGGVVAADGGASRGE